MTEDLVELLKGVRQHIQGGWIRFEPVRYVDGGRKQVCLAYAVTLAVKTVVGMESVHQALRDALTDRQKRLVNGFGVIAFNDHVARDRREVVALINRAIRNAGGTP